MSDGELVRLALAGRAEAYEELVRRHAPRVTALVVSGREKVRMTASTTAILFAFRSGSTTHEDAPSVTRRGVVWFARGRYSAAMAMAPRSRKLMVFR